MRSALPKNSPYRNPNAPKVYFSPIAVRLVKKYVGVDVKRQSLTDVTEYVGKRRSLGDVLNSAFGLHKTQMARLKINGQISDRELNVTNKLGRRCSNRANKNDDEAISVSNEAHVEESGYDDNNKDDSTRENEISVKEKQPDKETAEDDQKSNQLCKIPATELDPHTMLFTLSHEQPLDETALKRKHEEPSIDDEPLVASSSTNKDKKTELVDIIDVNYILKERRSSRSTFRTRNSARLQSKSSNLSAHNLDVAGISRSKNKTRGSATKEKEKHFYLDYGDGKLHDIMEIPRTRDCSRPWCNPHCKTCLNRATSRPCFILIPADENVRKSKLPQDKRRISMASPYNNTQLATEHASEIGDSDKTKTEKITIRCNKDDTNDTAGECQEVDDLIPAKGHNLESEAKNAHRNTGLSNEGADSKSLEEKEETIKLPIPIKPARKKGFSRKRIDQLALPKGGPSAEVRFSKTSLRRTQTQLIENERTKALSEFERGNLTYIQGKISVFLALMNEQEHASRDPRSIEMRTDRGHDINLSTSKIATKNLRKGVKFSPRPSYKILS